MPIHDSAKILQFDAWELDLAAMRLLHHGRPVPLERLPLSLLALLVLAGGRLVSRREIEQHLWGDADGLDVEAGINTAIRKIRRALGKDLDGAAFIDTVPGLGYRFTGEIVQCRHDVRSTVAVLPFDNFSADPELAYLAEGLTEETIAALGQVGGTELNVLGRRSVAQLRMTMRSPMETAQELGADHLVEGSVRADGNRLRITCRVVRAVDQMQVWSGSYDRDRVGLLELQRELCMAIALQVCGRLSPKRMSRLVHRHTQDAEAYELYLNGLHCWNQLTPPSTQRAIGYFTQAVQRDPGYALAWSGLADAFSTSPITGDAPPRQVGPRATAAAARAVQGDPGLAEAQTSVGVTRFWLEWDWIDAETCLQRAIDLSPSYAYAHRMLAHVQSQTGRHEAALASMAKAREIDPLYAMHHALSSQLAFQARDNAAAKQFARQALALAEHFWIAHYQLAQACEQDGDLEQAIHAADASVRLSANSKAVALRGYLLARSGLEGAARDVRATLVSASRERFVPPYALALLDLGLNERDAALASLRRALDERDTHLVFLPVDPKWDPLRKDARFNAILADCGFPAVC